MRHENAITLLSRRGLALFSLTLAIACATATASRAEAQRSAHIDEGVALYEQADLEGALAALARAEESTLDRGELLRLLATRALVRFGLGDFEPLERDLLAIATIEPDYDLGMRAPPPLANAFARERARVERPLRLEVAVLGTPAGARIEAEVRGDRAGIVRSVVIEARPAGGGSYVRGHGGMLVLPVTAGHDIELFARAIGPGNAVIAFDGTEEAPRRARVPAPRATPGAMPPPSDDTALVVGITSGAVVLVALAAVIVILVATSGNDGTRPVGPIVER